jgi:hypothetical protein
MLMDGQRLWVATWFRQMGLACRKIMRRPQTQEASVPKTLTVDLHPVFRSDRDIDSAVRSAIFRAVAQKVALLEIIPGKGSGTLKRRILAKLAQPHLKRFYRRVEADSTNEGRILVHFDPPSSSSQT